MAFREIIGTALPFQVLPLGNQYVNSNPIAIDQYKNITFHLSFQETVAGVGVLQYRLQFSNDRVTWYDFCEFMSGTVVAGTEIVDLQQRAVVRFTPIAGGNQQFIVTPTFLVPALFVRISLQDQGDAVTPGSASAEFYMRGDG